MPIITLQEEIFSALNRVDGGAQRVLTAIEENRLTGGNYRVGRCGCFYYHLASHLMPDDIDSDLVEAWLKNRHIKRKGQTPLEGLLLRKAPEPCGLKNPTARWLHGQIKGWLAERNG